MFKFLRWLTIVAFGFSVSCYAAGPAEVIANRSARTQTLTVDEVRAIFTLKRSHWPNGLRIHVVVLPRDSLVTRKFAYDILRMSAYMFYDSLEASYATGKTNIPTFVASEQDVIIKVSTIEGGIGFVYDDNVLNDYGSYNIIRITNPDGTAIKP